MRDLRRLIVTIVLTSIAVFHGLTPSNLTLDWPTVTLLTLAVVVYFGKTLLPMLRLVRRIRFGAAELELAQMSTELYDSVAKVETAPNQLHMAATPDGDNSTEKDITIKQLATIDVRLAIIQCYEALAEELQRLLSDAHNVNNGTQGPSQLAKVLMGNGSLTRDEVAAIQRFTTVRNQIVHAPADPFSELALKSTLESGLSLLRIIRLKRKYL